MNDWSREDEIFYNYFKPEDSKYFHYTTQDGLVGILSSLSFRSTDIRFFNDSTEVKHAYSFLKDKIDTKKNQTGYTDLKGEVLRRIQSLISETVRPVKYVVCFSSKEDDLNQWRSYASPGAGYSMGFDLGDLGEFAASHGAIIGRCIYGTFDLERIVAELLTDALWQLEQYFPERGAGSINEDLVEARSIRFVELFARIAPLFKNGSFEEEKEMRVIFDEPQKTENIGFRSGNAAIIPYLEVSLELPDGRILFPETICVKNTEMPNLTRLGVEKFLLVKRIDPSILKESSVPYREKI